jgi:hypothetical protein
MKTTLAALLLLTSTTLLADRPDCSLEPRGCMPDHANSQLEVASSQVAAVSEPDSILLIGIGLAGLMVSRLRKR